MTTPSLSSRGGLLLSFGAIILFFLHLPLWAGEPAGTSSAAGPTVYVCPPCNGECDNLTFDHPGICPHCGMTLVPQAAEKPVKTVAILLFDGVQIIDYSGPWEVFGEAGYRVFTVAETAGAVKTVFGQSVIPTYTFESAPRADILVVPGGDVGEALCNDRALIHWVQAEAAGSSRVLSVCTGAFLMAKAGLLDGLTATTYHGAITRLAEMAPKTKVIWDQRYVDNGKMVVTAGLSSGIDGALHLVATLDGLGAAQGVALNAEYDWKPGTGYARAALADRNLDFKEAGLRGTYLFRDGTRDHWKNIWRVDDQSSVSAFTVKANALLSSQERWVQQGPGRWAFTDEAGAPWHARSAVADGGSATVVWTLEIARD